VSAPRSIRIGIDVGSTTTKLVAIDAAGEVVASRLEPGEPRVREQTERLVAELRASLDAGAGAESPLAATGYGRKLVGGATRVTTEITCHARGAFHLLRRPGVLVDVGGQDTKVIRIEARGDVGDFAMNDKCAAGTGRFLEVILPRLGAPWTELAAIYARAPESVAISSTCTVFAESEVISLLANGRPVDGIVRGLHDALAERVGALAGRLASGAPEVFVSGGVANNGAMVAALAARLGRPITVVPQPQLVGALGAALGA
jgi:predicted CoA-substrate-specific enzyme activase